MKLSSFSKVELAEHLASHGLVIPCGSFNVQIQSKISSVVDGLHRLYCDFPALESDAFVDFTVKVETPSLFRSHFRPQVNFLCDDRSPFKPLPLAQAFAMLEWGLNWLISSHGHDFLVIHAAVVERDGGALILAADPGSGKSTLCAALVHAGWRLLSDELALVRLSDGLVVPVCRPISLKNRSIEIVKSLGSDVIMGPVCPDTAKGDIAHMRPPLESVTSLNETAAPAMLVFPRYQADTELKSSAEGKGHAFVELIRHAFNFPVLGPQGFEAIDRLINQVETYRITYSSFDQVLPEIDRLWPQKK